MTVRTAERRVRGYGSWVRRTVGVAKPWLGPRVSACLASVCAIIVPVVTWGQTTSAPSDAQRQELLAVRDSVWRAYYANDQIRMRALVPGDLIAINPGSDTVWQSQPDFLADAKRFAEHGGRLVSLTFPKTEVQVFGAVAVLYSLYALRFEVDGASRSLRGRATEVFVLDHGRWRNPGWHLDSGM